MSHEHQHPEKSPMARRLERLTGLKVRGKGPDYGKGKWIHETVHMEPPLKHYSYVVETQDGNAFLKAGTALAEDLQLVENFSDRSTFQCVAQAKGGHYMFTFSRMPEKTFKRADLEAALECVEAKRSLACVLDASFVRADKEDFIFTVPPYAAYDEWHGYSGLKKKDLRYSFLEGRPDESELRIRKEEFWKAFAVAEQKPSASHHHRG